MKYAAPTTAPENANDFALWVLDELRHISDAFSDVETDTTLLREWNVQTNKLFAGLIVFADGTNFDPGQGRGFYGRYAGAWHKLDFTVLSSIDAQPGSLTLTGAEATLLNPLILDAQPGSLILTGANAGFLAALPCTWDADGQLWDADGSLWNDCIIGEPGALILTGSNATFAITINAQPGALILTGAQTGFDISLSATPGALTLTGADATFITTNVIWDDDGDTWDSDSSNWDD